jgi:ligand-binding sensor domain-containing protein/signal transduction histidine kinase
LKSLNSARDYPYHGGLLRLFASLIGVCLILPIYAVDPNRAMTQYVRDHWGVEQGFPKGPLYAITQTADGYLWIGTQSGLFRFDGWSFSQVQDPSGVYTITGVYGLTPEQDGSLWILSENQILLHYKNGTFERPSFDEVSPGTVSAISRSSRGELLVSKMEGGTFDLHGAEFQRLAAGDALPRSPVISLAQTRHGDVWMGTRDAGLFRLTGNKILAVREGLPDLKVNCLAADGDQNLWVGTDNGVVRWNGDELTAAGIPASLNHFQALAMVEDRDGNLWVGTDSQGLLRFNSQGVASLPESDGVPHNAVTAVFEDREGDLWVGGSGGIERLRDSPFVTYSTPEGLPTDGSNPVYVDAENRMWFPPVTGGLWWVKGAQHGHISNGGLDRAIVYSIDGAKGELWAGRQSGGLTRIREEHGSFTAKSYTQADGLAQNSVYAVYLARDGSVWAGTLSAGVSMLRNGKFTNYTIANGLVSNTVVSILEGSDGTMWFATPSGLSALSHNHWHTYTTTDGLPSDNANCMFVDSTGVLWVGTVSGIAFQDREQFRVPARNVAPLREEILGIAEDKYGSLWLATSGHVLRVNREKLLRGTLEDGDVREYGLADGLRGLEGVKRQRSVIKDPAGRIWFSLKRGISVVDPSRLTRNAAPAIAHIQTVSADGQPIGILGAVRVPGGHQRITFSYVGLSLSRPDRVLYRYQLERYDHAWREPVTTREADYTNVPPGRYRFRVMATNPDGVWSSDEAALAFQVDPLTWQTWWFQLSLVAACVACMLLLYRMRMRQVTSRINMRFQERLAERTRIAQELHDTLLQGFLSASMQVHVAADSLPDDSRVKPTLTRALELMRQVVEEGRNAVRGLRSSQSVSLDLEHAFSRIQQELVTADHIGEEIDFRVIVEGEQKPLNPVLRDEVYRIGREALVNAFRHAHAKTIEMELKYSSQRFCVFVRDDGRGIDPGILHSGREGHWGLSGMRERADRIGAQLHVMSSATAGTEVELLVPGQVAFQNHSKPSWFRRQFLPPATGGKEERP